MSELPSHLKNEASKVFEAFLSSCSTDDVFDLIHGKAVLTLAEPNRELDALRIMSIEDAYAYLKKGLVGVVNKAMAAPAVRKPPAPALSTKDEKIDYLIFQLFGRTYSPPPKAPSVRKAAAPRTPTAKKVAPPRIWQANEVIRALSEMRSSVEGEIYLNRLKPLVAELEELAGLLHIKVTKQNKKKELLTKEILKFAIGSRRDMEALYRR